MLGLASWVKAGPAIDRHALVSRHDLHGSDFEIPLGNGNFAFNADGTGLETFSGNTMSHWCWHSFPLPPGVSQTDIKPWATSDHGRLKGATTKMPAPIYGWSRVNPHPLNLGRIGFVGSEGARLQPSDVRFDSRHLEMWTGLLESKFTCLGQHVTVKTCVDPKNDTVAVQVTSPLLKNGRLKVLLDFPAPSFAKSPWVGDFSQTSGHRTDVVQNKDGRLELRRTIDETKYDVVLSTTGNISTTDSAMHRFVVMAKSGSDTLDFTCGFGATAAADAIQTVAGIEAACADSWMAFWKSGGAIDLSGSKDPRWMELERRIVLSQYQLAVQSAGDYPPAEVGLTGLDPWRGKWHFEMIWWHLAHYALWDRWPKAEKALSNYQRLASVAREIAKNFDYRGLMWPKQTGPNGYNDGYPSEMPLLWKEPHPIFFAELDYRLHPNAATLAKWKDVVFGTADFMADYPTKNATTGHYDLDPVWAAWEGPIDKNTIFELGYWHATLEMAQQWRLRLGLKRDAHWDDVAKDLAPLPTKDGLYIYSSAWPNTFALRDFDHLDHIGIAGMLPPFPGLDPDTARRTVKEVARDWQWERVWGWDFPWLAMAAARVSEPKIAVEALLNPAAKNHYDERGLCTGGPPPYLPGNGGLLYAVAMMAAGWDGAPHRNAPGFPDNGSWKVRWEGLKPAP